MKRTILLLLLISLTCATFCTAFRMHRVRSCICNKPKHVKPERIKSWTIHDANDYCKSVEIVVMLKNGRKLCLDPNSIAGRAIMNRKRLPI